MGPGCPGVGEGAPHLPWAAARALACVVDARPAACARARRIGPNPYVVNQGAPVGRVVVDVMPKPEILDPQGKAVANALPRLGFGQFTSVRQGKRFELEVDGPVTPEVLEAAAAAAEQVLSNPVIEDVVRVADIEADAAATVASQGLA